jgi:hypothetical protein
MIAVSAQRTVRLTKLLHAFSLALSGEAGSRLLANVGVPTSADTLLRLVKRSQLPAAGTRHPLLVWTILRSAVGKHMARSLLICPRTARSICSPNARLKRFPSGLWSILASNLSVEIDPANICAEQWKEPHKRSRVLDRWHVLKNVREVVQRIVSRNHAILKQRQKDAGS